MTTEPLEKFRLGENIMQRLTIILMLGWSATLLAQTPRQGSTENTMKTTPESRGGTVAAQMITQGNNFIASLRSALEKGIPAQESNPAVTPDEIKKALGSENVSKFEQMIAVADGKKK